MEKFKDNNIVETDVFDSVYGTKGLRDAVLSQDTNPLSLSSVNVGRSSPSMGLDLTSVMDLIAFAIEDDSIDYSCFDGVVDQEERDVPDQRSKTLLDSLAFVGIESCSYDTDPHFCPHNRDFFLLPTLGEFIYKGETVEDFNFPSIGAEKFSRNSFQSIGVASPSGVLASGVYTDVIDSAREKLDGEEVIVYRIKTRSHDVSFVWGPVTHYLLPGAVEPGHYELCGSTLFFLGGVNALNATVHPWEYLSSDLVNRVKNKEGLIVRMSGKEYRLPWVHTATLCVRGGIARDLSNILNVKMDCPDGLYDFGYNKSTMTWTKGKARRDKVRADSNGGIQEMLVHASLLGEFLDNVTVGSVSGFTPKVVRVATLSQDRRIKIKQSVDCGLIKIRSSGGYKQPDSYRRILVEDCKDKEIDTYALCHSRPNVIVSCGRVTLFKRHVGLAFFKYKGNYFTNSVRFSRGRVVYFRMKAPSQFTINLNGPVLRLYEADRSNDELGRLLGRAHLTAVTVPKVSSVSNFDEVQLIKDRNQDGDYCDRPGFPYNPTLAYIFSEDALGQCSTRVRMDKCCLHSDSKCCFVLEGRDFRNIDKYTVCVKDCVTKLEVWSRVYSDLVGRYGMFENSRITGSFSFGKRKLFDKRSASDFQIEFSKFHDNGS